MLIRLIGTLLSKSLKFNKIIILPVVLHECVAKMEKGRSVLKKLASKPTGKRPRRRYEGNIRIYLKEIRGIGLNRLIIGIIGELF